MAILDVAFYLKDATFGVGNVFRDTVIRFCLTFCTVIVLSWVAVTMYVSFYYAYMPTVHHSQPVFLEFSSDCVATPENVMNGLCSFPEANVSLSKGDRILMRGQRYQVYLDLDMPQSPVNERLGMFMVSLKFLSDSGKIVATSSRSSMLHFKSGFLKAISTMFMSFPLMMGFSEEKQTVAVKMFENYVDDSYHPVNRIKVIILARHIEIYGANIRIEAEFSGFRYILFNWPLLSAVVCISANFIVACIVFFFAYHAFTPDPIETEVDTTQVICDGQDHLYSEARRRDLRRSDQRIPRTRSPSPSPPHNTGRLLVRTLVTRNKAPNAHSSFSSSTAPTQYNSPPRRLRSASFPPCRSEADDLQRPSSAHMAETVRGAPSSTRGGGTEMYLGVPLGRGSCGSDGNGAEFKDSRGYQSSPEVDTVHPLTYSELNDPNSDTHKQPATASSTNTKSINIGKSKQMGKSLSFDSGVQRILPSYTVMNLKLSKDAERGITSTGDIVGQTADRYVNSNGHLQDNRSLPRQIPDGAPADIRRVGTTPTILTKAKSEEQCSSPEDEKTSLRRRSPSKTRSKFGSSFRKMLPRR